MGIVLGKSKSLIPKPMKEIKYTNKTENNAIKLATNIAKSFGQQSKKIKPKKIIFR